MFAAKRIHHHLATSPRHVSSVKLRQLLALNKFTLIMYINCLILTINLVITTKLSPLALDTRKILVAFYTAYMCTLVAITYKFVLDRFKFSRTTTGKFTGVFKLLVVFASNITLPISVVPNIVIAVTGFLPN